MRRQAGGVLSGPSLAFRTSIFARARFFCFFVATDPPRLKALLAATT